MLTADAVKSPKCMSLRFIVSSKYHVQLIEHPMS